MSGSNLSKDIFYAKYNDWMKKIKNEDFGGKKGEYCIKNEIKGLNIASFSLKRNKICGRSLGGGMGIS